MDSVARHATGVMFVGLFVLGLVWPAWAQLPTGPAPSPGAPGQPAGPGQPSQPFPGTTPPPAPGTTPTPGETPKEKEPEAPPAARVEPFRQRLTVPEQPIPTPAERLAPPTFLGPNLFNPPAPRGWITFTPTITLSEEFNDNVGAVHSPKEWDFITSAIPGFTFSMQRPTYRLTAGYSVSAELPARDVGSADFGRPMQLVVDGFYQFNPRTSLSMSEQFVFDRASQNVSSSGLSAGQQDSLRNTLSAGVDYQATQLTGLSLTGSYTLLRYSSGGGLDSDTYRISPGVSHDFTARLSGGLSAESAYFEIKGEPSTFSETPRVSARYAITRRLSAFVSGGPSFLFIDGETDVKPAVTARLQYALRAGSTQIGYERAVTAETIGATETETFYGSADWTFSRNLRAEFTPRYTIAHPNKLAGTGQITVLSANLSATYQIARLFSLIASYTYFQQRGEHRVDDIDQNRVFFGLQYGYPINFE